MSLDVYLKLEGVTSPSGSGIFIRENGQTRKISRKEWDIKFPGCDPVVCQSEESDELYSGNITHNLNTMAYEAGIYEYLWRPEKVGVTHAHQLIEPLEEGLKTLKNDPDRFRKFNPSNGWGSYEGLVEFVEHYLRACKLYPTATVSVSR